MEIRLKENKHQYVNACISSLEQYGVTLKWPIGDFHLKPYDAIATPEITQLKLNRQTDSFIVLHTDGISHVMSDKEITELVRNCPDAEYAANVLTSCALQYGSEDNITAIVIPLRLWGKYRTQQISKELSLLKSMRIKYN